ncbi:hypothetical protein SSS_08407 [Sarcoptes scabiei]|uniref:TATA box-binding protein-associated factor RNA polymerase I subunit A-like protein n=1 Tax=Sarcoptes scabiei TaxID=52283 RepID=A0A834RI26_SARSC|nr:hypothetical protein SSS_08407 [Sarcoptes scabiei]UXI22595.1 hypothetical protein NH340_JMT08539 [Sarcoptes scabiei]
MSKSDSETEIDSNNSSASVDNTANGEFHSEQHNDLDEQNETSQNSQAKPRPCWGISHFRKIQMINKMSSLLRIACDLYAGHKWNAFLQLSSGLLIDTRLPDYMLIKHFIFFLYQNPTIDEENFKLVQKYFDRQIVFMEEYFDVTIELIIFLLSNQRLLQTGKLYVDELMRKAQKHYCRSTSGRIAKITPKPRVILRQTALIYYEYLDYIHWKTFNDDPFSSISVIRINKMKTNFQSFLNEFHNEELNLDIVALVLIHLCELDNNLDEALEYLIKYRESFPNNLNSQVYLYEFLRMNPEIDHDPSLRIECLKNIVKLCPDSKYVLHLASVNPEISNIEKVNLIEMICDYLDYNQNQNSLKAWKRLVQILKTIHDNEKVSKIQAYFQWRLKYWNTLHFDIEHLRRCSSEFRMFKERKNDCSSSDICSEDAELLDNRYANSSFIDQSKPSYHDYRVFRLKQKFLSTLIDDFIPNHTMDSLREYRTFLN